MSAAGENATTEGLRLANLEANVAFHLRLAQGASFAAFAELTGELGLRPGHYAVLQLIADNPGINQTTLSRGVGRDKTTLTPMLREMERDGFIERRDDPVDLRGRRVHLTEGGATRLADLAACARVHDARIDAIVGPDRQQLVALLQTIIVAFDR